MTDPYAFSDDLLHRERAKWRDRALAVKCRLMGNLPGGDFIDLREALSLAESELEAAEAEIARRTRG